MVLGVATASGTRLASMDGLLRDGQIRAGRSIDGIDCPIQRHLTLYFLFFCSFPSSYVGKTFFNSPNPRHPGLWSPNIRRWRE